MPPASESGSEPIETGDPASSVLSTPNEARPYFEFQPCRFTDSPLPRSLSSLELEPVPTNTTPLIDVDFNVLDPTDFGGIERQEMTDLIGFDLEYFSNPQHLAIEAAPESPADRRLLQRYEPTETGSPVVEFPTVGLNGSEEMWLSYDVRFDPSWEWVKGGKLPGLAGGTNPSGLAGGNGSDGFSARLSFEDDGHLAAYVYHPDRPGTPGEVFELCGTYETGVDLQLTQRVLMNSSPETFDGSVEVWVDGEKRLVADGLRFRTTGDFAVDVFVYSSFYGGNGPEWAPSTTTFATFDNFLVGMTPESVGFASER